MGNTLIVGGSVIRGDGSPPEPRTDVLVVGDRIAAVGPTAATLADTIHDVVRVDATSGTVMPGLIDAHTHVTLGEPASNDELFFRREPATAAIIAAYNVRKLLLAGVTSFLDADGLFNIGPALRDCINAGIVEGPTMKSGAFALMTAVGGTAGRLIPDEGTAGYAEVTHTRDEMIRAVRRQVKEGADCIKVHVTGSVPGRKGEFSVWKAEELKVVCDTAHELGAWVLGHCRSADATLMAAEAGIDIIYHGSFLDEACVDAILTAGAALCPTWTFLANLGDFGAKAGSGMAALDWFRSEIEATALMTRVAYDRGVPILCGTETGFSVTPIGEWHAREMEVLVQYLGISPLEAITCGTKNGTIATREQGVTGELREGMRADLLVVDGDPSVDITVLQDRRNLRHVFCRGVDVDLTPIPARQALPGERSMAWTAEPLTWSLAHP